MGGAEKKWGSAQERDLAIAIILAQQGERVKFDWPKVHELMTSWGYEFTRDAMSQHWTKRIMKDFKQRHGTTPTKPSGADSATSTPSKTVAVAKGKKHLKEDCSDDDGYTSTPSKKPKYAAKDEESSVNVKKEAKKGRRRERSMTLQDNNASFEAWAAGKE